MVDDWSCQVANLQDPRTEPPERVFRFRGWPCQGHARLQFPQLWVNWLGEFYPVHNFILFTPSFKAKIATQHISRHALSSGGLRVEGCESRVESRGLQGRG
jgi:hypothetical protein